MRGRDGYEMDGFRLRVEFPRGVGPRGAGGRPLYGGRDDYELVNFRVRGISLDRTIRSTKVRILFQSQLNFIVARAGNCHSNFFTSCSRLLKNIFGDLVGYRENFFKKNSEL